MYCTVCLLRFANVSLWMFLPLTKSLIKTDKKTIKKWVKHVLWMWSRLTRLIARTCVSMCFCFLYIPRLETCTLCLSNVCARWHPVGFQFCCNGLTFTLGANSELLFCFFLFERGWEYSTSWPNHIVKHKAIVHPQSVTSVLADACTLLPHKPSLCPDFS